MSIYDLITNFGIHTNWADFVCGLIAIIVIIILKIGQNYTSKWQINPPSTNNYILATFWYICLLRNAIVIGIATLLAYLLNLSNTVGLSIVGPIPPGLPDFKLPDFSYSYPINNSTGSYNSTTTSVIYESVDFSQMMSGIAVGIVICPIMAYLESYSMAKNFARKEGYQVDGIQEMYRVVFF